MEPKALYASEMERGEIIIKTDSVKQEFYDVRVVITNMSARPVFIWLMSCGWSANFEINNNYMFFNGENCDANSPIVVKFKPNESRVYTITLMKSVKFENPCENCIYGPPVKTTRVGLILIDDLHRPKFNALDYVITMEDKSAWKIIWSNGLEL